MSMENLETQVKSQVHKWVVQAQELIERTPPDQLHAAIAVVFLTVLLFIISITFYFAI